MSEAVLSYGGNESDLAYNNDTRYILGLVVSETTVHLDLGGKPREKRRI